MPTETLTWGWWASGASTNSGTDDIQSNYNNTLFTIGDGEDFQTYGYGEMVMVDGDDDGHLNFVQGAGNVLAPGNGDRLQTPDGVDRQLYELSIYDNSTFTYTDSAGDVQTLNARAVVYQLGNGDLVIRMRDDDRNVAPEDFYIENVTSIELGTWDGTDYANSIVSNFDEPPPNVCFVAGTLIETAEGEVPVEELEKGMRVITADHGPCTIKMVKSQTIPALTSRRFPHLRPIRIRANALGAGLPKRDLLVSPQHRILVRSQIARRMFNASEVLVAAKHLLELEGIEIAHDLDSFTYVHFLCHDHQIVFAEGAPSESLYLGQEAFKAMTPAAMQELAQIFPELAEHPDEFDYEAARPLVSGKRA
uniref:Hint domain-containing protein n=1 Tax=Paracoccus seriniphilus TaxID=184748 RepID=UPI00356427A0